MEEGHEGCRDCSAGEAGEGGVAMTMTMRRSLRKRREGRW